MAMPDRSLFQAAKGAGVVMRQAAALGLILCLMTGGAMAQDGTAPQEAQALSGAALDEKASDVPRDPNKGPVTNLPLPRFVTLKGSEGNARRGPGLTHRIDWVFTREGMPLKITAEYEHWRRVEDFDGAGGWVHYSLLSGVRSVLVSQDMAQAFSRPDPQSDVLFQSEMGVIGKLLQCEGSWCRIAVEGEKGWLPKTALWGVSVAEIYP
jgi:SH3-like domain-containing protein